MTTDYRSRGVHMNRRYGKTEVTARDRSGNPIEPTEIGSNAMQRGMEDWQAGDVGGTSEDMGMRTMEKVTGEMGGSDVILGGQQAPATADMAGTGMIAAGESMGGAEGVLGGAEGGMSAAGYGNIIGAAGSALGDKMQKEEEDRAMKLLMEPEPQMNVPQGRGNVGEGLIQKYVYGRK